MYRGIQPQSKRENQILKLSLQILRLCCFGPLDLVHTSPNSSLKFVFHLLSSRLLVSKMIEFLVVHMIQQAVMKISLKMQLLKLDLASMTISRGCKVEVPVNVNSIPAFLTEWAGEEEMEASFFLTCATKDTTIIIKDPVLSFEQISGV